MANVLFSRTDSPSTKPITDGQIIFDTSGNGKMYLDNGTTRLEMGGAINVDATLDATSTNPIQNKGVAGVMLSELEEVRGTTKKGFLTDALATKTLDAKIGTTDISSIGDGTVTGAISDVNGNLSNIKWKLLGSVTGKSVIDLPSDFTELLVEVGVANRYYFTFNIIKDFLTDDVKMYTSGNYIYYNNNNIGYQAVINATNSYIKLRQYKFSYGSKADDFTASAITKAYYK